MGKVRVVVWDKVDLRGPKAPVVMEVFPGVVWVTPPAGQRMGPSDSLASFKTDVMHHTSVVRPREMSRG